MRAAEWGERRQSSEHRQSEESGKYSIIVRAQAEWGERVCCCRAVVGRATCVRCTRGLVGICLPYAAVQVSCVYRWMRRASVGDECGEVNMYARLSRCPLLLLPLHL